MNREAIIKKYIDAYNNFDVEGMLMNLAPTVKFVNITSDVITMSFAGLEAFKQQAEQAKDYFSERKQSIVSFTHTNDQTIIEIDYEAVLAIDFPNGMKKGEKLILKGRSIFEFYEDTISAITDIS
jgi:ketosteroid isomerase-like protein